MRSGDKQTAPSGTQANNGARYGCYQHLFFQPVHTADVDNWRRARQCPAHTRLHTLLFVSFNSFFFLEIFKPPREAGSLKVPRHAHTSYISELPHKATEGRGSLLDTAFRMQRLHSKYLLTCSGRWTDGGFFSPLQMWRKSDIEMEAPMAFRARKTEREGEKGERESRAGRKKHTYSAAGAAATGGGGGGRARAPSVLKGAGRIKRALLCTHTWANQRRPFYRTYSTV